ncbi:glycosyltransferase family 61 protein [Phaeodactylibacter sp.]|uniref:glycosyltransferase 61 family protein n=1 Tax=Phaeodactylibacter sp. TaxID=1940289 RepID=UPI0025D5C72D|nr:glycosyltransferase family 61 protein [Phaeodactylibacter sp.]MCI4648288.1 glycosyltransferase family 61 protein [Phaeodactylibacter sp.]MCI5091857.1 glycosyltransferase family 61 protein [Phaeodactylibacter sp.]
MHEIKLSYLQKGEKGGSKEHYWHFMLGYLLPSLNHILKVTKSRPEYSSRFVFEDCGPVMNDLIEEIADLFSIQYRIENNRATNAEDVIIVPRWDILLRRSFFFLVWRRRFVTDLSIRNTRKFPKRVRRSIAISRQSLQLKKDLLSVRDAILSRINDLETVPSAGMLLLKRSEMPAYYSENGQARKKGYGNSRRSMLHLEEGMKLLREQEISATIYEPGKYSLVEQIHTFHKADGIVAIRGADLANMLWLKPGSLVLMVNPMGKGSFHIYNYCCILKLFLVERLTETNFPSFLEFQFDKLIKTYA